MFQCLPFVNCYVVGLFTLDDVLRFVFRGMMHVAFDPYIRNNFLDDHATNSGSSLAPVSATTTATAPSTDASRTLTSYPARPKLAAPSHELHSDLLLLGSSPNVDAGLGASPLRKLLLPARMSNLAQTRVTYGANVEVCC